MRTVALDLILFDTGDETGALVCHMRETDRQTDREKETETQREG